MCSVINFASDGKDFSFGEVYISCMMNCFSNNFLTSVNVGNQGSYIVFDIHVCYDKHSILLYE